MSNRLTILVLINFSIFCAGILGIVSNNKNKIVIQPRTVNQYSSVPIEQIPDLNYNISNPVPVYKDNDGTWAQLQEWNKEAPDLVEIGVYGKSTRGHDLRFIKIENEFIDSVRPVVLITACIHGNEPLSASTTMGFIGTILDKYGDDDEITSLIDERIIYFIPIVSPDSYPYSRYVDGVDPNRNFPGPRNNRSSAQPIAELQKFFKQIKPNAVISGHTPGRIYLTPYGDRTQLCPNESDYQRIIGEMGRMSQYKMQRACQMYGHPIYGTEVDWYYRNGAFSMTPNGKRIHRGAFAIVMEFGVHQRIPNHREIKEEFNRTFKAVLHFIQQAPLVEIWWSEDGQPVNRDGSPKGSWIEAWKRAA